MTAVQAAFAVVNKGVRPVIPNDCLPVLSDIMTRCWDTNPEVRPPFTEIVRMLENAETEIMTSVRKARFRDEFPFIVLVIDVSRSGLGACEGIYVTQIFAQLIPREAAKIQHSYS
ncbi:hypothetical protein POTOM_061235 [Populus tomentosa]|uniref:Serine-threonine/tyrosine-protein kinase catalytic domain-containing protein n=1 Tax=Populus tomentosa TaxID=118781 RepID=A0A8X8BVI1_POPTO|nr:hypothetical protein POTOM_061235 [Populus tomentosa]